MSAEVGSSWLGGLVTQGLDEVLEGKEVGAAVQAKAFAPPHNEQHPLAGQEIDISAEVLDQKRPELPEVNGGFAKAFDFDSVDEMVETVTRDVAAHKERERNRLIENLALLQLVEKSSFELPAELIEREVEDLARGDNVTAMALAPMAVLPDYQGQGIGSALVREGLEACRRAGHRIVVVLGHADYYPRFGFKPANGHGLRSPFPVPDEAFMAMALVPGGLDGISGVPGPTVASSAADFLPRAPMSRTPHCCGL